MSCSCGLPVTRLAVSLSGDVRVESSEEPEVVLPPLLFALWWVGVLGGGVTVT